jgi:hypothetical protein
LNDESIKITKLNKRYKSKVIAIILWVIVSFLILRGIGTIVRGNIINLKPFKDKITRNIDKKTTKESKGVAFAENFAAEYFSYSDNDKEYYERLTKYSNLDFSGSKVDNMDAIYVNKIEAKWAGSTLLVDLKVKVKVTEMKSSQFALTTNQPETSSSPKPTAAPENNTSLTDILYIRIPVSINGNACQITGYPTFIKSPGIEKADEKEQKLPGEILKDAKEEAEIKDLIGSFLKCYHEGNKIELSYFLKSKKVENYLNGEHTIKSITKIDITKDAETYYATAYYQVSYKENTFNNGMEFKLVKAQDKLLIETYNSVIN